MLIAAIAMASLAFASSASASPPALPFKQCAPVGFDPSCGILIVVNASGGFESFTDPYVGPFDGPLEGEDDVLVGVQNDSSSTVTSIPLKGKPWEDIFGFDGDELCSEDYTEGSGYPYNRPEGCPFGPTDAEGPNTRFTFNEVNFNEGTVSFLDGGIQPGGSAYFSLEESVELRCEETQCEPTELSTELSGGGKSGTHITVPDETAVSDSATLSGPNASIATGEVAYAVYSDPECKHLVTEAGLADVSGEAVPSSHSKTLAPGTYYWQVSYTGDAHNGASESTCGAEVENVESPVTCTKAVGKGQHGTGSEKMVIANNVNTGLTGKQKLHFTWNHGQNSVTLTKLQSASCVIRNGEKVFSGHGEAKEKKVKGYEITFKIRIAPNGRDYVTVIIEKEKVVVDEFVEELLIGQEETTSDEVIS
jgi:hypothetical protein